MSDEEFTVMWEFMDRELKNLGVSIVTGHTGRYAGCEYPMLGGATMIG